MATEDQRACSPPVPLSPLTTGFPTSNGSANLMSVASPSRSSATKHEHPYAFKSTSSAVLTRSNSIGNNSRHTHHLYAPPTPQTPGLSRSQSTGHRHTRSLSNVAPPTPLPMPPSPSTPVRLGSFDASSPVPYLVKRHETLASMPPSTQTTNELKISDLPVSVLLLLCNHVLLIGRGNLTGQPKALDSDSALPVPYVVITFPERWGDTVACCEGYCCLGHAREARWKAVPETDRNQPLRVRISLRVTLPAPHVSLLLKDGYQPALARSTTRFLSYPPQEGHPGSHLGLWTD